jgi:hypothetical protein
MSKYIPVQLFAVIVLVTACGGGRGNSGDPDIATGRDLSDVPHQDLFKDTTSDNQADSVSDSELAEIIAHGKELLARGESMPAYQAFYMASLQAPDNGEALYGLCLAQMQSWTGIIDLALGNLSGSEDPDLPQPIMDPPDIPTDEQTLTNVITNLRLQSERQLERLEILQAMPDIQFTLDAFPIFIQGDAILTLQGKWDLADVYAISGLTRGLYSLLLLLDSQHLPLDISVIEDLFTDGGSGLGLAGFLHEYPTLLTLRDGGSATWIGAHQALTLAVQETLFAAELMQAETDDQSDDVAVLWSEGADGPGELILNGIFRAGLTELPLLWQGKDHSYKAFLERLADHLEGQLDSRVRLDQDFGLVLAILLDLINKTTGIDTLLEGLGVSLPDSIKPLLEMVPVDDAEALVALVVGLLPLFGIDEGAAELDLQELLSNPTDLRSFFPATGLSPFPDGQPVFLKSMECPRIGLTGSWQPGELLSISMHASAIHWDSIPGSGNDTVKLLVSVTDPENPGESLDEAEIELLESDDYPGLFTGQIITSTTDDSLVPETLLTTAEAGLYVKPGFPEGVEDVLLWAPETEPVKFGYAMNCAPESAWDGAHFFEPEFGSVTQAAADGSVEPITEITLDEYATTQGTHAFGSPSWGKALWLDMEAIADHAGEAGFPAGFALANQRMLNRFLAGVIDQFGSLL